MSTTSHAFESSASRSAPANEGLGLFVSLFLWSGPAFVFILALVMSR